MAVEIYANQPSTTVSSGGTTAPSPGTGETWTVASSATFPAASSGATPPAQFHVADTASGKGGELIAVTNVSGTTWTVTRGAEGTTPVTHTTGFTITQVVTAGALGSLVSTAALPLAASLGGTGQASAAAAITALTGTQAAGSYLRSDGTNATLHALAAADLTGTAAVDTTGKSAKTDALNSATTIVSVAAATAPATGQVLTATDSTHATWQAPGSGSTVDWLNVRTGFGAAGNGSTDDTTAIQNAINALPANGGTVYFPAGNYKITSALTVDTGTVLTGGTEAGGTVITQSSTTADAISSGGVDVKSFVMSGIRLSGPGSGTGNGVSITVATVGPTDYIDISDVRVLNFGGDGIRIDNPIVTRLSRVVVSGCGGNGFNINGAVGGSSHPATSVTLQACYAITCGKAGYQLTSAHYSSLISTAADGCGAGYILTNCQFMALVACGCESLSAGTSPYNGQGFEISGGLEITLINPQSNVNTNIAYWITGSSRNILLISPSEKSPSGATASVQVDSGSYATVQRPDVITATVYTGTVAGLSGPQQYSDTDDRFRVDTLGTALWGSGTATPDTNLYRSAASTLKTDDSLTVGTNLAVTGTSAFTGAVTGVTGQYVIPPVRYAPGTQTVLTVSTTTLAAFSSASVTTGAFTAPASGAVLITFSCAMVTSAAGCYVALALAAHGTVTPVVSDIIETESPSAGFVLQTSYPFLMTGLTPGTSYNFDLLGSVTAADTASIYAFTQTGTTPALGTTGRGGPVIITVQAV